MAASPATFPYRPPVMLCGRHYAPTCTAHLKHHALLAGPPSPSLALRRAGPLPPPRTHRASPISLPSSSSALTEMPPSAPPLLPSPSRPPVQVQVCRCLPLITPTPFCRS
jgi:hypothetical protein